MEANNKGRFWRAHWWQLAFAIFVVLVLIALGIWAYGRQKPVQPKAATTTQNTNAGTSKPLTAGGQVVPVKWRNKALRLGYYCPSWNASPGQITSQLCLPLDK